MHECIPPLHTHTHTHKHMLAYTHTHTHAYTHARLHTHTHTHTLPPNQGASVDAATVAGSTALMDAVWYGHSHIINFLLKNGARMDKVRV